MSRRLEDADESTELWHPRLVCKLFKDNENKLKRLQLRYRDLFRYFIVQQSSVADVVAQLVEQSLPTSGVRRLNPVIGKIYITYML